MAKTKPKVSISRKIKQKLIEDGMDEADIDLMREIGIEEYIAQIDYPDDIYNIEVRRAILDEAINFKQR